MHIILQSFSRLYGYVAAYPLKLFLFIILVMSSNLPLFIKIYVVMMSPLFEIASVFLQAFESQNESKRKPAQPGSDQSSPDGPDSSPTDEAAEDENVKDIKDVTNKTEQTTRKESVVSQNTPELGVTDEDSPKKLRYPLGKARSAGLLEASNTDSGSSPEFTGVRSKPHRAMSEKSPHKPQTDRLEKPKKEDTQQNESMRI